MKLTLLHAPAGAESAFGVELRGRRQRAVLELLLIEANQAVSIERITDELWPEDPPKTSRNSIQRFVADIRTALGDDRDRLETVDGGYRLRVEPNELDVDMVRDYRARAESRLERPAEAAALLRLALDHFGPLGEETALTASGRAVALEHEELRLQIVEQRMEAEIAAGAAPTIVDELTALTRQHPYRERLAAQLMRALQMSGQRVAAVRAYERLRRSLTDDIGIEPSAELRALELEILEGTAIPESAESAVAPAIPEPVSTSASQFGLVGREEDLETLERLVREHRLVTLVGPGGVGKTTLATATCELQRTPPLFVRLAEIRSDDELPDLVAAALGVTPEGNSPDVVTDEVVDVVARAPRLIVLDNAEHVMDATTAFARQLLDHSKANVLVTSREHLGLTQERVLRLGRLSMPSDVVGEESESERLFRMRAEAMGVDVASSGPTIATVCDALEGLPLAIELAAAQMTYLGIRDLADRLDSMLDMTAHRPTEHRHSSLTAVLQWSWDLLSEDEAAVVEKLAVFQSRLSAATVEQIVGSAGMRTLASLVAKNVVGTSQDDGRISYALAPSVRRFAMVRAEQRGALDDYRSVHVDYLLDFLRRWSVTETNSYHDVIAEVAVHRLEYVPALEWLDEQGRHEDLVEMVSRVTGLWGRRGPGADLKRWAERVIELRDDLPRDPDTDAAVLVTALEAYFRFSDYGRMAKYGERLVALEETTPTDLGTPLVGFYGTAIHTSTLDDLSRKRVEAAFERAQRTPSAELNLAQTEMWLGSCQLMGREFEAALASFLNVLDRTRRPGGTVLWSELGRIVALHLLGRDDEAWAAFDDVTSEIDDSIWNYNILLVRAVVRAARGDTETARVELAAAAQQRMLERRAASRDDFQIGFGLTALFAGEDEVATELLAEPMAQSPLLTALMMNHLHPGPATPAEWQELWAEENARRLRSAIERLAGDLASVEEEIRRWWPQQRAATSD